MTRVLFLTQNLGTILDNYDFAFRGRSTCELAPYFAQATLVPFIRSEFFGISRSSRASVTVHTR